MKNNPTLAGCTWQDDRIEKARRVWEWWRAKAPKFNLFFTASHLLAMCSVSSCDVERVFRQVKFIIEMVGKSLLEEMLEMRLMERVNHYEEGVLTKRMVPPCLKNCTYV